MALIKTRKRMIKKMMTVCVPLHLKRSEDCHAHVPADSWQGGKPVIGIGWGWLAHALVLRNKKPW